MLDNKVVAARIREIEARLNRSIQPQDVVDDARDPSSPLHGAFEWDTAKAALTTWLATARKLITVSRVVITTSTASIKVPQYVRDHDLPSDKQGYRRADSYQAGSDAATKMIEYEFDRALSALRRAAGLAVTAGYACNVDAIVNDIEMLKSSLTASSVKQAA